MDPSEVNNEDLEIETSEDTWEESSEEVSEDTSEEISSEVQIDYTETLTTLNENVETVSNRLDFISASFWIFLSILITIIFYRLFAWFFKDL